MSLFENLLSEAFYSLEFFLSSYLHELQKILSVADTEVTLGVTSGCGLPGIKPFEWSKVGIYFLWVQLRSE